jgi:MFS family permease
LAPVSTALRHARWALTVIFAVDGMVFAAWSSRLPQVEQAVNASNQSLGTALLGTAVGAFIGMPAMGWLCRLIEPRIAVSFAVVGLAASILLPGLAHSPATLFLTLLAFGAAYGSVDVAMNTAAVRMADEVGRPIVPTFHSAYSFGGLFGAGTGSIAAATGTPVQLHFFIVAAVTVLCLAVVVRPLLAHRPDPVHRDEARTKDNPPLGIVLRTALPSLAVAALLTFGTGLGVIASWAAIHLVQDANASPGVAPMAFAGFSLAQAILRAGGTRLTERLGPRQVVSIGALCGACGFALTLVPSAVPVLCGYIIVGIGVSSIFPLGTAYAGQVAGSVGISITSSIGYIGVLLGPPLTGVIAGATSLTTALIIPGALAVTILAVSGRIPRTSLKEAEVS